MYIARALRVPTDFNGSEQYHPPTPHPLTTSPSEAQALVGATLCGTCFHPCLTSRGDSFLGLSLDMGFPAGAFLFPPVCVFSLSLFEQAGDIPVLSGSWSQTHHVEASCSSLVRLYPIPVKRQLVVLPRLGSEVGKVSTDFTFLLWQLLLLRTFFEVSFCLMSVPLTKETKLFT